MPNPYLAKALREQQARRVAMIGQSEPEGYDALTVDDLRSEVARRNEGRDEASRLIAPSGAKKADLIKALEADDNTNEES